MKFNRNNNAVAQKGAKPIFIGVVISVLVGLLGTVLVAFLLGQGSVTEKSVGLCTKIITFVSAFLGSLVCVSQMNEKIMLYAGICNGVYFFLLAALNILAFDGRFNGVIIYVVLFLFSVAISSLIGAKRVQGKGNVKFRMK